MKKRTKIIILSVMVLLLGVTGYLNIMLNRQVTDQKQNITTTASYFASYRNSREMLRDQQLLSLDAIIADSNSSENAKVSAENKKLQIYDVMNKELVIENLIKGKGFNDCVITINDGKVTAVVQATNIDDVQAGMIYDVIKTELKLNTNKNVKIMWVE